MRFFAVALVFFGVAASFAQTPEVPHKMQFAGMVLTIRDDARREIQQDVDALTQHSRYFNMKVERARTYFPVIEKIFAEEGVPDDFKFLVLQESALVADAVSVSNAVGFWQFKDFTAMEMGMRVDKEIDERMNLVSATHGAAQYLKKNNLRLNNWLLALQSYQMGAGGVQRAVGDKFNGANHMEITSDTYWYVKKYLAHKVTFENAITGEASLKVIAYQPRKGMSLRAIAAELSAQEEELKEYNKWLKTKEIPDDKPYTLLVPMGKLDADFTKLVLSSDRASRAKPLLAVGDIDKSPVSVNSIPVIAARVGENATSLAMRGKLDLSAFLKFNDISIDHEVTPGEIYLLGKKKPRGEQEFYKTKAGDDLWTISQHVGVRMKNLQKFNHLISEGKLAAGTTIWLKGAKPRELPSMPQTDEVATLADDTFDWYTKTPREPATSRPVVEITKTEIAAPLKDSVTQTVNTYINPSAGTVTLPRPTEHVVKQGDTFYSIARQYGVTVTDLLNWNKMTVQNGLKPSQILKVAENDVVRVDQPAAEIQSLPSTLHEVQSTDTLYSIARQYGVTIKDIMDWNHKKDFSLSRGEKLEIRRR